MAIINRGNAANISGTVVAVDSATETINFCSAVNEGSGILTKSVKYEARPFDKEFFDSLCELIKQEIEDNPEMDVQNVSLVLPDQLFLLDTVSIPVIHKKAMQQSLSLAIENVYKNAADLSLMTYAIQQNKQTATFGLVGVRREILSLVNDAFNDAGAPVSGITYAASSMANAAMALNGKLKNGTFLILDIKADRALFAFVVRGCTMGYYELPFGYDVMHRSHIVSEESLFDHRAGKLLVLNSKEKARTKHSAARASDGGDALDVELASENESGKGGKKSSKAIQRPTPSTEEGYVYENFRVFLKWTLELINNNRDIATLGKLDTVYVNMPSEYDFLFDVINAKQAGRGITFAPLLTNDCDASVSENLELYGGFFMNRLNEANTF